MILLLLEKHLWRRINVDIFRNEKLWFRDVRKCTAQIIRFWLIFILRLVILSVFTFPFLSLKMFLYIASLSKQKHYVCQYFSYSIVLRIAWKSNLNSSGGNNARRSCYANRGILKKVTRNFIFYTRSWKNNTAIFKNNKAVGWHLYCINW